MGLFKPAWQSKNEKRAVRAVEKLKDQVKIESAATDSQFSNVRFYATSKLTNQRLLERIAQNDEADNVRACAIHRLTDQEALMRVAIGKGDDFNRQKAMKQIKDPDILILVAKNGESKAAEAAYNRVCQEGLAKGTSFHEDCAFTAKFNAVRKVAQLRFYNSNNLEILRRIMHEPASQDIFESTMCHAIKAGDSELALEVIEHYQDYSMGSKKRILEEAVGAVSNRADILEPIMRDRWFTELVVRNYRGDDISPELLLECILGNSFESYTRQRALVMLGRCKESYCEKIAPLLNDKEVKTEAAYYLAGRGDRRAVAALAQLFDSDGTIRKAADALSGIPCRETIDLLLNALKNHRSATMVAPALIKLYKNAPADLRAHIQISSPKTWEHHDVGDHGRSCHGDLAPVSFCFEDL